VSHRRRLPPHHHESARRHLVTDVLTAGPDERPAAVRARLVGGGRYEHGAVYVIENGRLVGYVPLAELLVAGDEPLVRHMHPIPGVAHPDDDQEHVAGVAVRHRMAAVPVVDDDGRMLGIVPPLALIGILRREHVEDLHRLAGIETESAQVKDALTGPPTLRARHRLPWLMVGLAGSMLATFVMSRFEGTLQEQVRVAFFVPGIVYLADAIGTQTEAIAVRGLSLSDVGLGHLLAGEIRTGLIIGVVLAAVAAPAVWLAYGDTRLALAVAASVLAAGSVATTVGLLFPWLLQRLGTDPAFGAGPVGTILQDTLSILIFFLVIGAIGV
jgi:magnesium transporter